MRSARESLIKESLGLAYIFCPNEEENRTQSGALWRIKGEVRAKKMGQDSSAEFISDSYNIFFVELCSETPRKQQETGLFTLNKTQKTVRKNTRS